MPQIHVEIHDKVAWITLDRPEKLNALSAAMLRALDQTVASMEEDPGVRVLILTGAGDQAFAAGGDIAEFEGMDIHDAQRSALAGQAVFNRIEACPKPVIASVNGWALGGGCELALACHIRVASDEARFGLPEVTLGLIPGFGGTQRLPRLVGRGVALDLLLSGEPISAADALAMGLVSRVFGASDLRAGTEKLARTLTSRAPLALRSCLAAVQQGMEMSLPQGLQTEATLFSLLFATQDRHEGVRAFIEKRPARFKGQ